MTASPALAAGANPGSPLIVVPDTTPLILLAAGDALHLLGALGRVVVPDVVRLEATRLLVKPFASEIAAWLATATMEVAETEMGELYRLAIDMGKRPPRHAGEFAIIEWLIGNLGLRLTPVLVVADDGRVSNTLAQERLPGAVSVVTTRGLLHLAQENGLIASADVLWSRIESEVPTAHPVSTRKDFSRP